MMICNVTKSVLWSLEQVNSYKNGQKGQLTPLVAFPFWWVCRGGLWGWPGQRAPRSVLAELLTHEWKMFVRYRELKAA